MGGREADCFMVAGREDDRPGREDDRLAVGGREDACLAVGGREVDRCAVGGRREVDRRRVLGIDCFFLAAPSGMAYGNGYCEYTTQTIKFDKKFAAAKCWRRGRPILICIRP